MSVAKAGAAAAVLVGAAGGMLAFVRMEMNSGLQIDWHWKLRGKRRPLELWHEEVRMTWQAISCFLLFFICLADKC